MEGAKFASKSGGLKGFLDVGESLRSLGATVTIGERFEWRQLVSPLFAPLFAPLLAPLFAPAKRGESGAKRGAKRGESEDDSYHDL